MSDEKKGKNGGESNGAASVAASATASGSGRERHHGEGARHLLQGKAMWAIKRLFA